MSGLATSVPDIDYTIDDDEGMDKPEIDGKGQILQINHGDGSITVSLSDDPLFTLDDDRPTKWFGNLAEKIDNDELARIADELIRGIEEDDRSRSDWLENRAQGMKMLGLKLEVPGQTSGADGAPVEGMSTVRHPLLLEAVLRFQANARSELLPSDGPVKIRNDDNNATVEEDSLADCLERDMNHYLTSTASEYYPDTDRMLLMTGFGGDGFKKVYECPLRNRPVSESVDASDLIVNDSATDLVSARRKTHRIKMRPSVVKRMQLIGVYRDIDLGSPKEITPNAVDQQKREMEGVSAVGTMNPDDRDREIFECYCELDIKGYEHKKNGKATGLEIPYRVTIDVSSREILSIVRDYNEDTKDLPVARKWFVKYPYVPGFGFYDIGLLHILGNTTNALTASWRIMIDNGMYNNFPGGLISKSGARQNSNIFRVSPGSFVPIETGGQPIQNSIMPLPYSAQGMPALLALTQAIESTGQRVGGTSEISVGEGNAEMPVGTTLALLDQASKIENSVHKRLHAAQAEEFRLLCGLFEEHPEAFWERNSKPTMKWDKATFLKALSDYDLVPQADPNTSSHTQRVMKVTGLKQLQATAPQQYNPIAVDTVALQTLGFSNPQQFFANPETNQGPQLEVMKEVSEQQIKKTTADARMLDAQTKAKEEAAKERAGFFNPKPEGGDQSVGDRGAPSEVDMMQAQTDAMDAQTKREDAATKRMQVVADIHNNSAQAALGHAQLATDSAHQDLDRSEETMRHIMQLAQQAATAKATAKVKPAAAKKKD